MKTLILILIITLSQVTISLSQTPTDIVDWDNPNAFLLEKLTTNEISSVVKEVTNKKIYFDYDLTIHSKMFNFSCNYMNVNYNDNIIKLPSFYSFILSCDVVDLFSGETIYYLDSTLYEKLENNNLPPYDVFIPSYGRFINDSLWGVFYTKNDSGWNTQQSGYDNLHYSCSQGYESTLKEMISDNKRTYNFKYKKISFYIDNIEIKSKLSYNDLLFLIKEKIYDINELFNGNFNSFGVATDFIYPNDNKTKILVSIILYK